MSVKLPAYVDWEVWRVVTSDRIQVGLNELLERWSLEDVWDAHAVLDAVETASVRAAARPRKG